MIALMWIFVCYVIVRLGFIFYVMFRSWKSGTLQVRKVRALNYVNWTR